MFEKSIRRLDEIVTKLEKGDVPLDDALALFEEGAVLVRQCAGLLDAAEQRVMILTGSDQGEPTVEPFAEEEDVPS